MLTSSTSGVWVSNRRPAFCKRFALANDPEAKTTLGAVFRLVEIAMTTTHLAQGSGTLEERSPTATIGLAQELGAARLPRRLRAMQQ